METGPSADLAAIIGASADAVFGLDHQGAVRTWNRAAGRLLGRPDATMRGFVLAQGVTASDLGRWKDVLERVRAGGRSEGVRLDMHQAGGPLVPVLLSVWPGADVDGGYDGAWVVARDLTEQLLAQQTLADSEQRVRRGEVLAGTGSFVIDREDAAVQWSHGMYMIYGVRPEDFEPSVEAHLALVHSDDRPAVDKVFQAALTGDVAGELDHRTVRPDGGTGWVFLAVEPIHEVGRGFVGARGVCQDVTQRKLAEAAARAALERERAAIEELRRLDSVKEEFLATVSHELRTPLTAILGFSGLLQATCTEHDELLEPITRNAQDMHQMVERLLDYSRLEAGRVALEVRPLRLADQVRTTVLGLEPVLAGRPARIDVDEDLVVCADADALERILVNLIGNAAKYSDAPASITVSAARGEAGVVVSVSDEGPGIDPQHHGQVFERFFRVPGHSASRRGTGVGLAIVRQYVELHGGHVSVQSAPGSGTTFRFDLPTGGAA
jgi:PAS domain S-box-containing protein